MSNQHSLRIVPALLICHCAAHASWADKDSPPRTTTLWAPFAEWSLENKSHEGIAFDLVARVTFTHSESGKQRVTEMFYDGGELWRFRFTGTQTGEWTFATQCDGKNGTSNDPELHGLSGTVTASENPNPAAHGFITNFGNKWGWQGSGKAFVPQYVMAKDLNAFYDAGRQQVDEAKIDRDIAEFVDGHGFTGFHLQARGRWFDINGDVPGELNPDPRSYVVLETVIRKVHERGGACHLWMWGKDRNNRGDGPRGIVGGPMSPADRRNLRYLAARLGPLPGWSIGYGYDTENLWASPQELDNWKGFLEERSGWDHFIGARVGFDEKGLYGEFGKGIPQAAAQ